MDLESLKKEKVGEKHKILELNLTYDNPTIPFESYYFWLIDFIKDGLKLKLEKLSDVFGASPGSSFTGEMSQRAITLLNQGRQLGALINEIVKAILSIIYEIKWIKSRLKLYDQYKKLKDKNASENEKRRAHAALLSLKSLWIDRVDSQKGNASLLALSRRIGTSTVLDVFFGCDYPEDVDKLVKQGIINERVARIVKPRLMEFWTWLDNSEKELRSRYSLLISYLKHEVNALFTYFEFARPYLRLARKLLMKDYESPDVVSVFETAILELKLLVKGDEEKVKEYEEKDGKIEEREVKYLPLILIEIYGRMYPMGQRVGGSTVYQHLGRLDLKIYAFLLKEDEYKELEREEFKRDLLYIEGMTKDTVETLIEDLVNIFDNYIKETGRKDVKKGLEWLYDLYEKKKKEKERKKEKKEKKKESKNKQKKINPLIEMFFGWVYLLKPLKEVKNVFTIFKPKESDEIKFRKKIIDEEKKKKLKEIKENISDTAWTIYETFKKNYGLLTW